MAEKSPRPFYKQVSHEINPTNSEEELGATSAQEHSQSTITVEEQQATRHKSTVIFINPSGSLKQLIPSERYSSYDDPDVVASLVGCELTDLKTYRSKEKNVMINTKNLNWNGNLVVDVGAIKKAVSIKVILKDTLEANRRNISLFVEAKLHRELKEQNRRCILKLESELLDKIAGARLDVKQYDFHETNREGNIHFSQKLVREEQMKSCSSELLNLILIARFYTY